MSVLAQVEQAGIGMLPAAPPVSGYKAPMLVDRDTATPPDAIMAEVNPRGERSSAIHAIPSLPRASAVERKKSLADHQSLISRMFLAFHHACDAGDLEIAERLLKIVEVKLTADGLMAGRTGRVPLRSLVAACERLWGLRNATAS